MKIEKETPKLFIVFWPKTKSIVHDFRNIIYNGTKTLILSFCKYKLGN